MAFPGASRKVPLASLTGLKDSVHFYIPAAFLPGNLVRDCNRDGCPAGMGRKARKVLGLSLELIVALTMDTDCNVPYVHTLCVALLLWLPWSDAVPGCCYAVEALEAMLSRLGSRCWLSILVGKHGCSAHAGEAKLAGPWKPVHGHPLVPRC